MSAPLASALALASAALACGDDAQAPAPVAPVTVDTAGRDVVAEVDGRPVFRDCVEAQAAAHGLDARAALDECIAFELLAREAERRGYAAHREVGPVVAREAVRALLRREFEAVFDGPEDIPLSELEAMWARPQVRQPYDHPEHRAGQYVRANVRDRDDGTAADREAERRIRALHAELVRAQPLTWKQMDAIIAAHSADGYRFAIEPKPYYTPRHGRAEESFAAALFAIPEVGMVSAPTRTPWGWDLIRLYTILPEVHLSLAEAEPDLRKKYFPVWRLRRFDEWMHALERAARIAVEPSWPDALRATDALDVAP